MRRKAGHLIPLEVAILEAALAVQRKGTPAFHGYALAKSLASGKARAGLTAYGTLYRALHRLQCSGLVESFWEDAREAEAEARPRRRLYRLTALAEPALTRARAEQRRGTRQRAVVPGLET